MKKALLKTILISGIMCITCPLLMAQDGSAKPTETEEEKKLVRFNGLGRTGLSETQIGGNVLENDTSTIRSLTDGEFLLDLKINATPNDKTEVQSILRLRNEFGGFFGAGMSVEVRELWARGIIADAVKYRVGDMDKKMTPYTLFMPQEEGIVNNPTAFLPQQEVIYYEQFYTGDNTRRLQGANFDFGLTFTQGIDEMDVSAFIARIRGTDFFTTPSRFISGSQIQFKTQELLESSHTRLDFGFNAAYTFDDLKSGLATSGIRNTVYTANYNLTAYENDKMSFHVLGESGFSMLEQKDDSATYLKKEDYFLDIGIMARLKPQKISITASFVDIGPDFFSIGAQSKRVEFDASKSFYNRIGTNDIIRTPSLFDLTRDRALYTFSLSDRLMPYDPRFSNTMPYGLATPNRTGVRSTIEYGESEDVLTAKADLAYLNELRGQGTTQLKNFKLARLSSNVNINKLIEWQKKLRITLGYQFEETSRDGLDLERVKLRSNLIEAGIESELFANFDLILGAKLLGARGRDYIPRIDEFNEVRDFPGLSSYMDEETLYAGGVKYTFKKGIYLTLQYHHFNSKMGTNNPNDYSFSQVFALYTMNF